MQILHAAVVQKTCFFTLRPKAFPTMVGSVGSVQNVKMMVFGKAWRGWHFGEPCSEASVFGSVENVKITVFEKAFATVAIS